MTKIEKTTEKLAEKSVHDKHRKRVYQEIAAGGIDHWPEHRVMEYLLFFCTPRGDTNPLAHRLIERFGSFAGVLEATEAQLCTVEGVGPSTARFLHAFPAIDRYYIKNKTQKGLRLVTTQVRVEYIMPLFRGRKTEAFYMIAMDERAKLIKPILLTEGSSGSVHVPIPKVVHEAAMSGASCVLFAHNHPNTLAIPSQDDITATGNIIRALGLLEIRVLDHIIVSNEDYFSLFDQEKLPYFNMKTGELRYY
ncbi:MAG: JAB domain-containing protein [Faecalibacterium sp.]